MQVCRDLICPQHSDLQVHRDLPLSAFLADDQIQITFCNYIMKHCNLFSFFLPSHHHTDHVATVNASFMGFFPCSHDVLNTCLSLWIETAPSSFIWKHLARLDGMRAGKTRQDVQQPILYPLILHLQTRGTAGCESARRNAVPHYCALNCRARSHQQMCWKYRYSKNLPDSLFCNWGKISVCPAMAILPSVTNIYIHFVYTTLGTPS